jgi:xanthine phosphoribosyltransferase
MKKVYVSWTDVQRQTQDIIRQMNLDDWRPDYVVGITRGGLAPAVLISQYLNVRMETLKVSLRDNVDCETNCWMPEDAFGYVWKEHRKDPEVTSDIDRRQRILIVDDINDSGETLNWIKNDWQSSCMPNDPAWQDIWNHNVRIAVLYQNESSHSELTPDYAAEVINKLEEPQWVVFPWEEWWRRWNPSEEHQ